MASAEALLNRSIGASARAGALAERLDGKSLQMDVDGVVHIRAIAHHGRLALLTGEDSPADATIKGSLSALLQLFKGGATGGSATRGVEIRGDAEIAERYRELFMLARPDPEEELSRWVGDLPARRLWQLAVGARDFADRTRRTIGENIAEYLKEEGRDVVNGTELEEFLRGVDELREHADRIEARLGRLEARFRERT